MAAEIFPISRAVRNIGNRVAVAKSLLQTDGELRFYTGCKCGARDSFVACHGACLQDSYGDCDDTDRGWLMCSAVSVGHVVAFAWCLSALINCFSTYSDVSENTI